MCSAGWGRACGPSPCRHRTVRRCQENPRDLRAVHHPCGGPAQATGAVRRQPALSHHRRWPGAGRGLYQAMRLRTDLARSLQAVLSTVDLLMLPTGEPAKKLEPSTPRPVHAAVAPAAFNVGGNPPCRCAAASTRAACRSRCRSSAACSTSPRSCAPATPTKRRRRGATNGRRCSHLRSADLQSADVHRLLDRRPWPAQESRGRPEVVGPEEHERTWRSALGKTPRP